MKKIFSFVALLFMVSMTFGQNFNSQPPYSAFESWNDGLPTYWHSYSEIECALDPEYCGAAEIAGAFNNHHKKVAGHHGFACQLYTISVQNRIINGALTTGKSRIASLTYTDPSNIVYTQRNGNCHYSFACRPDSISLWARFAFKQNENPNASIRIHIHGDVDYEDQPNSTISTPQTGKIANVIANLTNPATTPSSDGYYRSGWTHYAYKLTYWDANNNVIETPTLQNTDQPYYLLASLSTNPTLGFGEDDSVSFDEVFFVYDKGLASLKIDGVENDLLRNLFNQSEYATHGYVSNGELDNSGQWDLNDTTMRCYSVKYNGTTAYSDDMPVVTVTPKSSLILSCNVTQATLLNQNCVITIMHNDGSTAVYIIHFNLKRKPTLELTYSNPSQTACEGTPFTVTATGSSTSGPVQYSWSNGNTGNVFQPTAPGTYNITVTATDVNGCSTSKNVDVAIFAAPNVQIVNGNSTTAGDTSTICSGKTATLTASGAQTYQWSTGATSTSIVANAAGSYSVTGTSTQGCSSTASHVLIQHPNPNVSIIGANSICSGNTATLMATGANTYVWNNGSDQAQLTITTGGTYSVTGTNIYGCSSSASKSIVTGTTPTVTINGPSSLCGGSSITLTATNLITGTTLQWSNGSTANSITVDEAGTYSVTASLGFCNTTVSHQVSPSSTPEIPTVTPGSHCGAGTVTLTANTTSGNTCVWYATETTQEVAGTGPTFTINNLQATTTYYVCAQSSAGCSSERVPVEATIYTAPSSPTVSNAAYCGAGDYTLTATSPNMVQWYSDNAGTNAIDPIQYVAQTTTYYAAAVDNHQCRSSLVPMTVTINAVPDLPTVTPINPTCSNSSVNVILNAVPGANGNRVIWYDSELNFLGFGQRNVTVNTTTTYYVSSYNNNTQCESDQMPVQVVVNPIPAAPQVSCPPHCGAGNVTMSVIGNPNNLTIQWYTANDQYLASGNSYTANISQTTNFKAKAVDEATGCESSAVTVTAVVNPTYQTSFSQSVCGSYYWNGELFNHSGIYTRTFQTVAGCDSVVTLHLTVNTSKATEFDTTVCGVFVWQNQTYTTSQDIVKIFTSSDNCDSVVTCHLTILSSSYSSQSLHLCSNQLPYNYEGIATITGSGTKVIILTNAAGCDSVITLDVTVSPTPATPLITTNDTARCGSGSLTLNVPTGANGTTCLWYNTPTGGTPIFTGTSYTSTFSESTTFYISSYNANTGCASSRKPLHVTVNPVPAEPEIENAARCGAGQITLHATIDENSTFCFWYLNNTAATPTHAGLTYSPVIASTTYYYVESYNESTNCKSTRKPVVATVNPVPVAPQVTATTNCGPLTTDFSTFITANTSSLYRWYNSNNELLAENEHYNATVNESTSILVSNYNAQTTCESEKASINITINPNYEPQSIFDTVCQNTQYQEYGLDVYLNTVGVHPFVISQTASTSCDSLVTLYVTVKPIATDTFSIETCGTYTWNDITYETSGVYTQTFTAANGCDSIAVLNLTLYPTYQINLNRMICENGSYNFNGQTITEPGTYTANLQSVHGCDSIVTLQLTIGTTYLDTITAHVCYGDSYHQYGFDVDMATETQFLSHDTIAVNNCDSTTVLHLIVHEFDTTHIYATRCLGDDYNEYGFQIPTVEVGVFDYTRVIPTIFCDSTVILHLTVNPTNAVYFSDEICQGDTYNDNGFDTTFTEAGVFTLTHSDLNTYGCDSITTVTVTVHPSYHLIINESICANQYYSFNNQALTTSGTYVDTLSTIYGCDSIITLHLTINPTFSYDTTVDICENDLPFLWNNDSQYSFWDSDDYDVEFQTVNGCDSVYHLHLNVFPTFLQDTNVIVCQGAMPYQFDDDHIYTQSGNYTIDLMTVNGCDSIWILHLSVTPNIEHDASQSICDNELPFTFMGETFTEAGEYDITEADDDNCLTITHFTLIVKETYHHFDTVTVCQENLPFMYGDSALYVSGTYDVHFSSALSCDSLITVLFNVIPTAQGAETIYVCTSDFPYSYGGQTFPEEGTYSVTFDREGLCDSVVTLTLIEAPEFFVEDTAVVCDHELPYSWRNNEYTLSGIYYDSLVSIHGCDSVFALSLTVNPTQYVEDNTIVLCQGDSELWHGMYLSEAGTYLDTVPSSTGCREIHQVEVVVNPTYLFHDSVTICSDELPYEWRGMTLNEAGVREDYHQTVGTLCDSIYRLTLFVNPSYHVTESISACDYDLPILWHGQELTTSGTYYDTLSTSAGCDSTFELAFTVNASQHEILADTVCQNALPYTWRGHAIIAAGEYADTIPNATGCLDIFELHLNVLPADVTTIYDTVCEGSTYQLYGFDTIALQPGTLYDQLTLTNANGCDSTVNLVLTVSQSYLFETFGETCENTPYLWHGGEFVTEGTYYDSLVSSLGCDSVFVLHLTVNPAYYIFVSDSAMREHEYTYGNFVVTPADSGTYEYDIQYYTLAGCDSVIHLTLYVAFNDGVENFTMTPEFTFFPNPTNALLNIRGERMTRVEVFALNGRLVFRGTPDSPEFTALDVTQFATGHYTVRVTLDDGKAVTGKIIISRR